MWVNVGAPAAHETPLHSAHADAWADDAERNRCILIEREGLAYLSSQSRARPRAVLAQRIWQVSRAGEQKRGVLPV